MPKAALISGPSVEPARGPAKGSILLGIGNGRGNGDCYGLCDFVLQRENVGEVTIVTLGPNMISRLGFDQLRSDADTIAEFAQAAFEHIAHTEFPPHQLYVDCASLVSE